MLGSNREGANIRRYFEELIGCRRLAKEGNVSSGLLANWINKVYRRRAWMF